MPSAKSILTSVIMNMDAKVMSVLGLMVTTAEAIVEQYFYIPNLFSYLWSVSILRKYPKIFRRIEGT